MNQTDTAAGRRTTERRRGRRITAVLICAAMALSALPLMAAGPAQAGACTGIALGSGTASDPYIITTSAELAAIDDSASCMAATFVQIGDVDLGSLDWDPLGAASYERFSGTYYGNCYEIQNLTINRPSDYDLALFYSLNAATMRNIRFPNVSITGDGNLGALAGTGGDSTIDGVYAEGTITGTGYYIGMIVGDGGSATQVTHSFSEGSVTGGKYVGGIGGYGPGFISESYSTADVTGTMAGTSNNGGLVGSGFTGTIDNSYATGSVTGTDGAGGLLGEGDLAPGVTAIESSYATGAVSATVSKGGLVSADSVSYSSSFWDSTTTGAATTADGSGGTTTTGALSTAAMQTPSTFTGATPAWDTDIWNFTAGAYPTLDWFDDGGLTYCPRFTAPTPSEGPEAGGTSVTINGKMLANAASISFGGTPATIVSRTDTSVTVTAPAGTGTVAVTGTVVEHGLTVPVAATSSYTYKAAPPPPSGKKPNTPKTPEILAADRSIKVTVTRGAGGGTPTSFTATATPSGRTCTITDSTKGTCTITGLTNGTLYTIKATAQNTHGVSGPSSISQGARPGPTPTPSDKAVPRRLKPGQSRLTVDGSVTGVTVRPGAQRKGLRIQGDGWGMDLDGVNSSGSLMDLTQDGVLRIGTDRVVETSGFGFKPVSDVRLYVDPEVRSVGGRAKAKGIYVGTLRTTAKGTFIGRRVLPPGISPGVHDLQAVGLSPGNLERVMTLGVLVVGGPDEVRSLASTSSGTQIVLTWRAPADDGGAAISGYQMQFRPRPTGQWSSDREVTTRTTTITGTIPGCVYEVRVRAVNEVAAGPWSTRTVIAATGGRMRTPFGDLRCRLG